MGRRMISVIVACMNREHNLIQALDSWFNVPEITEFIVVDWSSASPLISNPRLYDWTQRFNLKLLRVNNQKYFSLPKAYNLAASRASNKILMKLDSDYKNINSNWMTHLVFTKDQELNNFFIVGDWLFAGSLNGFILVNKKDFVGYNENFRGWGYDDSDLYNRIRKNNPHLTKILFFNIQEYIYHIPHSEEERTSNYEIKEKLISFKSNIHMSNLIFQPTEYDIIKEEYNYTELIAKDYIT